MTSTQTRVFINTDELPYYEEGSATVTIRVEMNELPRLGEFLDLESLLNAYELRGKPEFEALGIYLDEQENFPYVKDIVHHFVKEETKAALKRKEVSIYQHVYVHVAMFETSPE